MSYPPTFSPLELLYELREYLDETADIADVLTGVFWRRECAGCTDPDLVLGSRIASRVKTARAFCANLHDQMKYPFTNDSEQEHCSRCNDEVKSLKAHLSDTQLMAQALLQFLQEEERTGSQLTLATLLDTHITSARMKLLVLGVIQVSKEEEK